MKRKAAVAFNDVLKSELKNPKVKAAYEEAAFFAKVALEIIRQREKQHMSQKDLAAVMHTTQQTISRIENADLNVTLKTVFKIAQALHKTPQLKFV